MFLGQLLGPRLMLLLNFINFEMRLLSLINSLLNPRAQSVFFRHMMFKQIVMQNDFKKIE